MKKIKEGDLITCKYEWNNEYLDGIGYAYSVEDKLFVGISCKDGGALNAPLDELKEIKVVKL